jgi:effector-binding domain-containing protein
MGRKIRFIALAVLLLIAGLVYFAIPSQIKLYQQIEINTSEKYCSKFLQSANWHKWLKNAKIISNDQAGSQFRYQQFNYSICETGETSISTEINGGGINIQGEINYAVTGNFKVRVFWIYNYNSSYNPVKRVTQYLSLKRADHQINDLLVQLKQYLEFSPNVYGFEIQASKIKDSLLLAIKTETSSFPGTTFIYENIDKLKDYAIKNGAEKTGTAMINITPLPNGRFDCTIAIPISKQIPENHPFFHKRMILGNFMETTVKGGPEKIKEAYIQMQNFITDHHLTIQAIPFESLITNRLMETDTSKWITSIYYPVL